MQGHKKRIGGITEPLHRLHCHRIMFQRYIFDPATGTGRGPGSQPGIQAAAESHFENTQRSNRSGLTISPITSLGPEPVIGLQNIVKTRIDIDMPGLSFRSAHRVVSLPE